MMTIVGEVPERDVHVPEWVRDMESFRRWTDCPEFPEKGYVWWLQDEVWIDMSREDIFTHLVVKNEFAYVLTGLAKSERLGLFLPDG